MLLSFFDSLDDCYRANFDTYENDGGYCVQYIPYDGIDYLETQKVDIPVEAEYFSIEIPHKLEMSLRNIPILVDNPSFDDYFAKEIDETIDSDINFWEVYESLIEKPSEYRIESYPSFVQQ